MKKLTYGVITPTYNSIKTIKRTYNSIRDQENPVDLWLVIDGQSTDGTVEFLESVDDVNIKIISEPDSGTYDAMNKGLSIMETDLVHILNSDDYYSNNNIIGYVLKIFENEKSIDAYVGSIRYINSNFDSTGRVWIAKTGRIKDLKYGFQLPHPGLIVRIKNLPSNLKYDTNLRIAADYKYIAELLLSKLYIFCDEKIVVNMQSDGLSSSWKSRLKGNLEIRDALKDLGVKTNMLNLIFGRLVSRMRQGMFKVYDLQKRPK